MVENFCFDSTLRSAFGCTTVTYSQDLAYLKSSKCCSGVALAIL